MIKAVIFDRDGVLLDSASINVISAVKAFKEIGINIKEEEKDWILGRHPEDYKKLFFKKYKFDYKKFRKNQRKIYFELFPSVPLFYKTLSLIKRLNKAKIPVALTTTASMKTTSQILKRTKLKNMFKVIVTFEDCKKRKPAPDPYLITSKKLNISPKNCLVIEDSFVGLQAAKKAKMKCIIIPNKYTKHQNFSRADLVVKSADEITLELLKKI